ncbi:hypothetical protein [Anaerosinus massiliensis]|uniref:hypothetical protein n=1 Tax=Massilibacillus massiliensis TaxID=1806837 RepID=UPI000DA60622|nr:hypothetical protein [Massilibacillus massiliensis]
MKYSDLFEDFYKLMRQFPNADRLLHKLNKDNELFLFGGCVRSYLKNNFNKMPRDFDIVLKKNKVNDIENIFKDYQYTKNRFGGFKIKVDNLDFDIWEIENTWAFKEKKVQLSEKNLCETVYLNIDAIVYDLNKKKYYQKVFKDAMHSKCLDIVLADNPYITLNLLRTIIYKREYEMSLSNKLKNQFVAFANKYDDFSKLLYDVQIDHYKEEKISINEINKEISNIVYA